MPWRVLMIRARQLQPLDGKRCVPGNVWRRTALRLQLFAPKGTAAMIQSQANTLESAARAAMVADYDEPIARADDGSGWFPVLPLLGAAVLIMTFMLWR